MTAQVQDDTFRSLEATGYAVLPPLEAPVLEALRADWHDLALEGDGPFVASMPVEDRTIARKADLAIKAILGPVTAEWFPGTVPVLASFITKVDRGEGSSPVGLHQDWTYVDERVHRSATIWIPLVDTTPETGCICVLPGSHRWCDGLRGTGAIGDIIPDHTFPDEHAVEVPLAAGTPIAWDSALVHGSRAHHGPDARVALGILVVPAGATLVHAHQPEGGEVEVAEVDESFFTTQPYKCRPVGYPAYPAWTHTVCAAEQDPSGRWDAPARHRPDPSQDHG